MSGLVRATLATIETRTWTVEGETLTGEQVVAFYHAPPRSGGGELRGCIMSLREDLATVAAEMEALERERDRYRGALERIAATDLKRASAGWIVAIAQEALRDHQGTDAQKTLALPMVRG